MLLWPAGVHEFTATDFWEKKTMFCCSAKLKFRATVDDLDAFSDYANEEFVPVITSGDGACGLHSVFGTPTMNRRTGETEMFCLQARSLPATFLGAGLKTLRERVSEQNFLQAVETELFADLWSPQVTSDSSNENRIFNAILQQQDTLLHARACAARQADICSNQRADAAKANLRVQSRLFFSSVEARHYVRVLADESGIDWPHWRGPCVDSDGYVKGTRTQAPSCIPDTKYDALFDDREVFDPIREAFWFTGASVDAMVTLLDAVSSHRDFSAAAKAQVEQFRSELRRFSLALAEPQAMRSFAEEAWPYYVQALQHENYWLSCSELVLLCQLAGVRVVILKQTGAICTEEAKSLTGTGEVIFVKIEVDAGVRTRVRSHFERVLPARTFAALERESEIKRGSGFAMDRNRRNGRLRPPRVAAFVPPAAASRPATTLHASAASGSVSRAVPPASELATPSNGAAQIVGDPAPSSAAASQGKAALSTGAGAEAAVASDSDAPSHLVGEISDVESSASRRSSAAGSRALEQIPEVAAAVDSNDDESLSDVSSDSDGFNVSCANSPKERTPQDVDLAHIGRIKNMLRRYPLLPPKPGDSTEDFMDVHSGVKFPVLHCAFSGCSWTRDLKQHEIAAVKHNSLEHYLINHLKAAHRDQIALPETLWPDTRRGDWDMLAYYTAAVAERERERMPVIGPSVDRRTLRLLNAVCNSSTVCSLACFCCCQVRTRVESWEAVNASDIMLHKVARSLCAFANEAPEQFERACSYAWWLENYGKAEERLLGAANPPPEKQPWTRLLVFPEAGRTPEMLLCNPEDVVQCRRHLGTRTLCGDCSVPLCKTCSRAMFKREDIPAALGNDNYIGYTTMLLAKYKVRWIEAAIASPCWTSMLIYKVEGDFGHLMSEEWGAQSFRSAVRGTGYSVPMPWQDILRSLQCNIDDDTLAALPRAESTLGYVLRVSLKVEHVDIRKYLKAVHVRPFVVLLLLHYLIDQEHEVFAGKGIVTALKERMRLAVEREYPETEAETPIQDRVGHLPESLRQLIEEQQRDDMEQEGSCARMPYRDILGDAKNATPGTNLVPADAMFAEIRLHTVTMDKTSKTCTDPDTQRTAAFTQYGELAVVTSTEAVRQYDASYFALALPFVIPIMASGPDFYKDARWRRTHPDAPWFGPAEFAQSFARRIEAQCKVDWTALPLIRSVAFKFMAEHTMSPMTPFGMKKNEASEEAVSLYVDAAQELLHALHHGHIGSGIHRVPIAGDTTKLRYANGLSLLAQRIASAAHFIATHLPGTQANRQLCARCLFGARVVYGDCLFMTVSCRKLIEIL